MANTSYHNVRSYKKDKKISIMEMKTGNNDGMPTKELKPISGGENIWAYYRHATAGEFDNAGLAGYKVEAVFRLNWRDDIKDKMKIRYKGNDYNITRIDDFEGYKRDLTIYAYAVDPDDNK